jgi:hypothetical protein
LHKYGEDASENLPTKESIAHSDDSATQHPELDRIAAPLDQDIKSAQHNVPRLVGGTAWFVSGLVLLTVADILVLVGYRLISIILTQLAVAVAAITASILASCIAGTVFASAVVGYKYTDVSMERERFAHKALQSQIAEVELTSQSSTSVMAEVFDRAVSLLARRVRCSMATQGRRSVQDDENLCANGLTNEDEVARILDQHGYDSQVRAAKAIYLSLFEKSSAGPNRQSRGPLGLYGLIEGYQELSALSNQKAGVYLTCLTFFAIALYLFGQAIALEQLPLVSVSFLVVGGVLVVIALIYAVFWPRDQSSKFQIDAFNGRPAICASDPPTSPEEKIRLAADWYETGRREYDRAEVAGGSLDSYRRAADAMQCAVAARPTFAVAHLYWWRAYLNIFTSGKGEEYDASAEVSNFKYVRAQKGMPAALKREIGFDALKLAILKQHKPVVEDVIVSLNRDPSANVGCTASRNGTGTRTLAESYLNLGLFQLVAGNWDRAQELYQCAVDRGNISLYPDLLWSTLTYLNAYATSCSAAPECGNVAGLTKAIANIKRQLIAGTSDNQAATGIFSDLKADITPSEVSWTGRLALKESNFDNIKLTVVWYQLDNTRVWRVIPSLSQTFTNVWESFQSGDLKRNEDGTITGIGKYLGNESECLEPGQYKAELYVNGVQQLGPEAKTIDAPALDSYRSRALNITLCHPSKWQGPDKNTWVSDLVRSMWDEEGRLAARFWTFYAPKGVSVDKLRATFIPQIRDSLAKENNLPVKLADLSEPSHGCDRDPPHSNVTLMHKEWIEPEGFFHFAVFLPRGGEIPQICQALISLDSYYVLEEKDRPEGSR